MGNIWTGLGVVATFFGLLTILINKPIESSLDALGTRLRDAREQLAARFEVN